MAGNKWTIKTFKILLVKLFFTLGYNSNQEIHEHMRDELSSHNDSPDFGTMPKVLICIFQAF